jgi:putative membrane protein
LTLAHAHPGPAAGPGLWEPVAVAVAMVTVACWAAGATRLRRRGDHWPWWRDVSFTAGCAGAAWAVAGPLPGGPFTAHMVQHVAVGMAAPLLLVVARPLTLALRALPPGPARRALPALAHSRVAGPLLFPPLAALLDVGGLWLLYRTDLFAAVLHEPWLHAAVHAHVLAAGLLFAFTVCGLDPVRRRWGLPLRGATLLAAGAAHAVLAKTLYAQPPPGTAFAAADLRVGAQVMYYGGDLAEAALGAVLALTWYRAGGRARRRRRPATERSGPPPVHGPGRPTLRGAG